MDVYRKTCLIIGIIAMLVGICGINEDCWQAFAACLGGGAGMIIAAILIKPIDKEE